MIKHSFLDRQSTDKLNFQYISNNTAVSFNKSDLDMEGDNATYELFHFQESGTDNERKPIRRSFFAGTGIPYNVGQDEDGKPVEVTPIYYPYGDNNTGLIDPDVFTGEIKWKQVTKEDNTVKYQVISEVPELIPEVDDQGNVVKDEWGNAKMVPKKVGNNTVMKPAYEFPFRVKNYNTYDIVGTKIGNVVFTDLSSAANPNPALTTGRPDQFVFTEFGGYAHMFCNAGSDDIASLLEGRQQSDNHPLDTMNKGVGIMFVNWNGAIIDRGDYKTERDSIVYDSAEFIEIFNRLNTTVFDNIIVKNRNIDAIEHPKDSGGNIASPNVPIGHLIKNDFVTVVNLQAEDPVDRWPLANKAFTYKYDHRSEVIENYETWTIIYTNNYKDQNNKTYERVVTFNNNVTRTQNNTSIPEGITLKVPDGQKLEIYIPYGGYGEVNLLKIGNIVYVRGSN